MESIITACIIFIISLVMFVISFRSFKEKGLKITPQRIAILKAIYTLNNHHCVLYSDQYDEL